MVLAAATDNTAGPFELLPANYAGDLLVFYEVVDYFLKNLILPFSPVDIMLRKNQRNKKIPLKWGLHLS